MEWNNTDITWLQWTNQVPHRNNSSQCDWLVWVSLSAHLELTDFPQGQCHSWQYQYIHIDIPNDYMFPARAFPSTWDSVPPPPSLATGASELQVATGNFSSGKREQSGLTLAGGFGWLGCNGAGTAPFFWHSFRAWKSWVGKGWTEHWIAKCYE